MIGEGFEFDEVEEIFEGVLLELNPYAPAGSKAARAYQKSTTASKRGAERAAARAATVAKVKGAVKTALGKAKESVKSAAKSARTAAYKPVVSYATKRKLHPAAGMAARSKDPEKRRGLRAKVAADIKGRIKKKVAQAQVSAYGAARKAGQAASDVAGKAKQSAKYTAARTKRGVKKAVGAAASGVAAGATRLASRMATEDLDVFDVVLEHLIENGYAETPEAAEKIMVNMSEEWRVEIIDEAEKWIQKAIKKPGALHKQLGVPEDEKIPASKLAAAAKKGGKLGKRARLAQTLRGIGKEE
jgi:hypothetical protein